MDAVAKAGAGEQGHALPPLGRPRPASSWTRCVRAKQAPAIEPDRHRLAARRPARHLLRRARHRPQRRHGRVRRGDHRAEHATPSSPTLFREKFIAPKIAVSRQIYDRAVERGEIDADVDLEIVAPALAGILLHRSFVIGEIPDDDIVQRVVDHVILPAVGHPATGVPPTNPRRKQDLMTDTTATSPLRGRRRQRARQQPSPGWALVLISVAQLMVVLDGTIVNIALPFIQQDLDIASANLRWVVTGYALAFGSLLLLGGRLGDLFGRRKVFMIGLVIFGVASLLGGLATSEGTAARRAWPPGPRRRAGLPGRPGADHHDVPGRPGAQPRLRGLRRHVRRGRGRRPAARRLADRPRQRLRPRRRGLAPHPADQHPDRHHHRAARAALPRRVRVAPGPARPARCRHRHARPARPRLRPQPRRHRRLDRHLDDRQPGRRRRPARRLPGHREPGRAPAAADPGLRQPHPRGQLRGDVLRAGGDVRDVLLPQPVHPDRDGLQPDPGRRRVPAVLLRPGGRRRHLLEPDQPDRPAATSPASAR